MTNENHLVSDANTPEGEKPDVAEESAQVDETAPVSTTHETGEETNTAGLENQPALDREAESFEEIEENKQVKHNEVDSGGATSEPEVELGDDLDDEFEDDFVDDDEDENEDAAPIETLVEETAEADDLEMNWYILKVQVNRETSICDALRRRVSVAGLDHYFSDILVPTEDIREFTKSGKQRIVKRKLYPGYVVVRMAITDESWFLVRETPGIGDFTGAAGKPAPLTQDEIDRILQTTLPSEKEKSDENVKIGIKYKVGDRVRVKEGNFQNYEGDVSNIDERNGRVTVMINIFNRPNPVELDHWQVEEFE